MMAKANGLFLPTKLGLAFGVIPVVTDESGSTGQNERVGCISWLSLTVPDAVAESGLLSTCCGMERQVH